MRVFKRVMRKRRNAEGGNGEGWVEERRRNRKVCRRGDALMSGSSVAADNAHHGVNHAYGRKRSPMR